MIHDEQIQSNVEMELKREPKMRPVDIAVSVKGGIVTLTGNVACYFEKIKAENRAQETPGVKAVVEDIKVNLSEVDKRDDRSLALAAERALEWDCQVPQGCVFVKVENGWIELTGEVESEFQRDAAINAVQRLQGLQGLLCLISIEPKVHAEDIKYKIEDALKQLAVEEAERIQVQLRGQKVILSGDVHSFAERRNAESAARNIAGISEVISDIRVSMFN